MPYFNRAAVIANGNWYYASALESLGAKLCFCYCFLNIGPSSKKKKEKVVYWPQMFSRGSHFLLRSTENAGGRGNPFFAIGFNAKSATNFRSSSAMRGAEFHGNTRCDGPTRIRSIYTLGYMIDHFTSTMCVSCRPGSVFLFNKI